jgi:hypothetical protein
LKELDAIVLSRDIEESALKQGDIGAIVHAYRADAAYEVEFVTGEGETIAVLTLTAKDIRPTGEREILHVRELITA